MSSPLPEIDPPMEERNASHSGGALPPTDRDGATPQGDGAGKAATDEARKTASTAAGEAKEIASASAEGMKQVAQSSASQAGEVAQEAARQVRNLADEARSQLRLQAEHETSRAASNLRTLSNQARALSEGRVDEAGPMVEQIRRLADQLGEMSGRLQGRGFDGLMEDVRSFARRRPAAFIGLTALAGFAITRVARSAGASSGDGSNGASADLQTRPAGALPPPAMAPAGGRSSMSPVDMPRSTEPGDVILLEGETVVLEDIAPDPYEHTPRRTGEEGM